MTQDDTFNILKRTPISELDSVYRERVWEFYADRAMFDAWLEKHGWDYESFHAAGNAYEQSLRRHYAIYRG